VPVSGGLVGALSYADDVRAQVVQVFAGNPRGWAQTAGDPGVDERFRAGCAQRKMAVFIHSPYLVNLGSPNALTLKNSRIALAHALRRGREIGARGVVVHTGSAVDTSHRETALRQVRESLLPLLDTIPDDGPDLLLEPTAGQGQSLCATVEDLEPYLAALESHPRVGICFDTCHAFAAGHNLAAPGGMKKTLDALVRAVGRGRLRLVHANDSKDILGSCRDRHEQIGKGQIGEEPFAELFRHVAMRGVPVVIETPGKSPEHRHDVERLQALRDR
jgi:deoxyribonuclease-4